MFSKRTFLLGKKYKYKNLIGADGALSLVRKTISGKNQRINFALETFVKSNIKNFKISFEDNFAGYYWQIPRKNDVCFGIGNVSGNTNLYSKLEKYLDNFNIKDYKIKGAFLPTGNDIFLESNNVYFIGDAAGLISPITGEGIYYAIISAFNLYNSFKFKTKYTNTMKPILKHIRKENIIKKFIYNTKFRNFIFKRLIKTSFLSKKTKQIVNKILL